MNQHDKGSSYQILQWIKDSSSSSLSNDIKNTVQISNLEIFQDDWWRPDIHNFHEIKTTKIPDEIITQEQKKEISDWWLKHYKNNPNTPNWDFLSSIKIDGKQGLLLVEAKSHKREMSRAGKKLNKSYSRTSLENHNHIGRAIEEANESLSIECPGINISRDSHYQLSNRIAFSWKLASMGIPVVLLYLGFLNDKTMGDKYHTFPNKEQWDKSFSNYIQGIIPQDLMDRKIPCGKSFFYFISRTKAAL